MRSCGPPHGHSRVCAKPARNGGFLGRDALVRDRFGRGSDFLKRGEARACSRDGHRPRRANARAGRGTVEANSPVRSGRGPRGTRGQWPGSRRVFLAVSGVERRSGLGSRIRLFLGLKLRVRAQALTGARAQTQTGSCRVRVRSAGLTNSGQGAGPRRHARHSGGWGPRTRPHGILIGRTPAKRGGQAGRGLPRKACASWSFDCLQRCFNELSGTLREGSSPDGEDAPSPIQTKGRLRKARGCGTGLRRARPAKGRTRPDTVLPGIVLSVRPARCVC